MDGPSRRSSSSNNATSSSSSSHALRHPLPPRCHRAGWPAAAPPPFPEPRILAARRVQGLVLTRQQESDGELDGWPTVRSGSAAADAEPAAAAAVTATTARMMPTPSLERRASVAGSILIVERADADGDGRNPSREPIRNGQQQQPPYYAFMLQRKVKSAPFGTVRVGYALQNAKNDHGVTVADHAHNTHSVWEVAGRNRSAGGACGFGETSEIEDEEGLVAVSIRERAKVLPEPRHANTGASQDPRGELSALQMVAEASARRGGEDLHVVGTRLVAADAAHVYTVTPFCKDGSLFDYCMRRGTLREDEARFFFRQILKGLATLQSVGLCHRNLNLQNVLLKGNRCIVVNLSCAVRVPTDPGSGAPRMIEPQPPCATHPQAVAPELLRNEPFDGHAVDLWAAGVALFTMLFGADALFAAPVVEDRKFRMICEGNLRALVRQHEEEQPPPQHALTSSGPSLPGSRDGPTHAVVSDSAVDLLQQMLRPDPIARLTLSQVLEHEWVARHEGESSPSVPPRRYSPMNVGE